MRYEILGQVRVWRDGTLLDLGPSQRRVILAVLLLHANRPVSREQLIDATWGEELPKYAANLAQKHISALRRQLEPARPDRAPSEKLTWTDAGYLLTAPARDVDLQIYEEEVAGARAARARGDLVAAAAALRRALRRFPGQPFEGLTSPLLDTQRYRLVEQRTGLVEERIELDLILGVNPDLVSELRQLTTDHPLRDRLNALLMLALYRDGQRAEALSIFHAVRRRLRDELGVDPPASLQTLHHQILVGDPIANLLETRHVSSTATLDERRPPPSRIDVTSPHPGRIQDYLLGGRHNFAADRELAQEIIQHMPAFGNVARLERAFIRRAVLFMVEAGIRQFLDLGSGMPALGNPHQVLLDRAHPECRIVCVDSDPVAIAHTALLFDPFEGTALIQADLRDVDSVLADEACRSVLDLGQPTGLIMTMLHFLPDSWNPTAIVAGYRDRLASGSYLTLAHVAAESDLPGLEGAIKAYRRTGYRVVPRFHAQVMEMCDGFDLVTPGLVSYTHWRPDVPGDQSSDPALNALVWAAVGRKP